MAETENTKNASRNKNSLLNRVFWVRGKGQKRVDGTALYHLMPITNFVDHKK